MTLFYVIGIALAGCAFALWTRNSIKKESAGTTAMQDIASAIQEGSRAYLKRQYTNVFIVAIFIAAILWYYYGFRTSSGFVLGAAASALAGYLGMMTAVMANVRVAEGAKTSLQKAFSIAFRGGSVTGFLVTGLGLMVVSIFWLLTKDIYALTGLALGGSIISVFARVGGGIYTKGADVGADLVGKIEAGIPEDDPRNPAVIADNVGDNVGDCAGMAADLFETYAVTLIAAMLLGSLLFPGINGAVLLPLALSAIALLVSIVGALAVSIKDKTNIMAGLYKGLVVTGVLALIIFIPITKAFVTETSLASNFFGDKIDTIPGNWLSLFFAAVVGLAVTLLVFIFTDYYTSKKFRPVSLIAKASNSGHGTNIIAGLAVGMEATILPILAIVAGIFASYWLFGLYGIAIAAVGMLSLAGIIVAIDSFGPITDNAGGIAEMSGLEGEVRENTDALDSVGNTTKAVTKGYAIASAGLAALVLFGSYVAEISRTGAKVVFELQDPLVIIGLFLGGMLPYIFGSQTMLAVGRAAGSVVDEVRRQFKEKDIMSGKEKPDYGRAVDIVTKAALKEMIKPVLIPILVTIVVALVLGPEALGGLLIGVIITGLFMALSMTSGGAAWDNAKKFIEDGNFGGKGSPAHQAAVTGDTVGDPYKDTTGPAINPMIKVVNIVALLLVGILF